jgi:HSP20 family protein
MLLATFPLTTFNELRREMDDLLSDSVREFAGRPYPALNAWETGEALFIEAELPGLTMQDVEVLVEGTELTIKGQRRPVQVEGATLHRSERPAGAFARTLTLPPEFDAERIGATLKDGVLSIRLPKSERAKARKIEVKAR